jgi:hypothetical protein
MTTIYGNLRVKETNEAISGLVVSIFAREMVIKTPTMKTKMVKSPSTVKVPYARKGMASNPFQLYTRSLGSTITNEQGEFRIEFDRKNADKSRVQTQPQLMLAVLAPSTTKTIDQVAALSYFKRLLHWIKLSPLGPDQTEAFVIQLMDEQLKHFNIKTRSNKEFKVELSAAQIIEAEKLTERFHSTLREGLAPKRKKRLARQQEIAKKARKFAASLYVTPKAARSQGTIALSKDKIDVAKRNAMEEGLANMSSSNMSGSFGRYSAGWNKDSFDNAGITAPEGAETIHIPAAKACLLLNERRGGTELLRVRNLLDAHKTASDAAARLGQEEDMSNTDETSAEAQPPEVEPSDSIARRVLGQIKDMPLDASEADSNLPQPFTRDELNAMLPAVQLGAGPTDVPSFHNFYHLQIAFPNVWTEAFDGQLKENIEELYKIYVQVNEEYLDTEPPIVELQEKADLLNFF